MTRPPMDYFRMAWCRVFVEAATAESGPANGQHAGRAWVWTSWNPATHAIAPAIAARPWCEFAKHATRQFPARRLLLSWSVPRNDKGLGLPARDRAIRRPPGPAMSSSRTARFAGRDPLPRFRRGTAINLLRIRIHAFPPAGCRGRAR